MAVTPSDLGADKDDLDAGLIGKLREGGRQWTGRHVERLDRFGMDRLYRQGRSGKQQIQDQGYRPRSTF
ncbi:hypothetical protein AEAC466_05800 [Asticcacaulis sp. AC466]|nr:hypothetical protein AEAC466_05800 [Asticcacaulis sp. AC466]